MKSRQGVWGWLKFSLLAALVITVTAGVADAYSISGTVTNNSGKSGRIYISVQQPFGGSSGQGVSIPSAGPFTIRGVQNGTYIVQAYMDTTQSPPIPEAGIQHASDPVGSSGTFQVNNGDVATGTNISLTNPPAPTLQSPQGANVMPGNGLAFVMWDPAYSNNAEITRYYKVYWSVNPNPGPANKTGGGTNTGVLPSTDKGGYLATGLTNGNTYYFAVAARLDSGGQESAPTNANGGQPVTIGSPPGGFTVSGTVDTTGITKTGPLWVAVVTHNQGPVAFAYVANPANVQAYSIAGVPAGFYDLYAILDMNNNHLIDVGDYMTADKNPTTITVTNGNVTTADFALSSQPTDVTVTTNHWKYSSGEGYTVNFNAGGMRKLPVNIAVSGPQLAGSGNPSGFMDLGKGFNNGSGISGYAGVPARPVSSPSPDTYSFAVAYSDGTNAALTSPVTGVVDSFPTPIYPVGNTAPDSTTPNFSWETPGPFPAGYYDYSIYANNFNMDGNMPATQLSVPSQGSYPTGNTSGWSINVNDVFGNQASYQTSFTPQNSGPSITGVSPSGGPSGTSVTITGSGFDTVTKSNNLVYFGGSLVTSANFQVDSPNQIRATVPARAPAGPVTVSVNGITAASPATINPSSTNPSFFNASVGVSSPIADFNDYPNIPIPGATMSMVGSNPLISTVSNGSGVANIPSSAGLPSGIPFTLKISAPAAGPFAGYADTYSSVMSRTNNLDLSQYGVHIGAYALYSPTEISSWGGSAGKAAIKTKVVDGGLNPLSDAVVTVIQSKLHPNTANPYPVLYWNGSAYAANATGTVADGRFIILNVDDGDVVAATAVKSGLTFSTQVYETHAGAVTAGSIKVLPVITDFSPGSGWAGQEVTINGIGFDYTTCGNNKVNFGGTNAPVTSCDTTNGAWLKVNIPLVNPLPFTATIGIGNLSGSATSSSSFTVTVAKTPTNTVVTPNNSPSTYGQGVQFTANVTPAAATGTIQFLLDGVNVGSPVTMSGGSAASTPISSIPVGSHTITAIYSGDGSFSGSTSAGATQTVNQATTTTQVVLNTNPASYGQGITFTANVTPAAATGTIQFKADGVNVGSPITLAGGSATSASISSLTVGTHTISAVYSGDGNLLTSTSAGTTQTVNKATPNISVISSSSTSIPGMGVTFTATISPSGATGTIQFRIDGIAFGTPVTLSGGSATSASKSDLPLGSYTITAVYSGDGNVNAATSGNLTQTVSNALTPTITWSNPNDIGSYTKLSAIQLNATALSPVSGTSLPGTFTYNPPANTILGVGPQTLSVTFTPDDSVLYTTANKSVTVTVLDCNGDMNGTGGVGDIADALMALKTAVGLHIATPQEFARGNVAPYVNGLPAPDNTINISDALIILKKAVHLISWP